MCMTATVEPTQKRNFWVKWGLIGVVWLVVIPLFIVGQWKWQWHLPEWLSGIVIFVGAVTALASLIVTFREYYRGTFSSAAPPIGDAQLPLIDNATPVRDNHSHLIAEVKTIATVGADLIVIGLVILSII